MKQGQRKIMWIASYPKSGNTWLRAFLANYLIQRQPGTPLPLTELQKMSIGDAGYEAIRKFAASDRDDLKVPEIFEARHRYMASIAAKPTPTFVKTHMPNAAMFGVPMIAGELSRCGIYVARNPLDVLISYADHMSVDLEKAASEMSDRNKVLGARGDERQIRQFLGDWSTHVRSWRAIDTFPVLVLRYEDMIDDPEGSFTQAIKTIGAPLDRGRLRDAINVTSFRTLQEREAVEGFAERVKNQERFFRSGTKDQWKQTLPQPIVDKVIADHGEVMRDLGYL